MGNHCFHLDKCRHEKNHAGRCCSMSTNLFPRNVALQRCLLCELNIWNRHQWLIQDMKTILMFISIFCPFPTNTKICWPLRGNCRSIFSSIVRWCIGIYKLAFCQEWLMNIGRLLEGFFRMKNTTTTIDFLPFVVSNLCFIKRNECVNALKTVSWLCSGYLLPLGATNTEWWH